MPLLAFRPTFRSTRTGLLAALFALTPPLVGQGWAQQQTVISGAPSCRRCEIRLTELLRLGDREGPGIIEHELVSAARDSRGRYYLHGPYATEIKVYGPDGAYLTTIGRVGSGPGEFRGISFIAIGAGDTIHVLDWSNMTWTVLSPEYGLVRSVRLEFNPDPNGVVLPSGDLVLVKGIASPERAGLPVHLVTRDGRNSRSFGSETRVHRPDIPYVDGRAIAVGTDGNIWLGYRNQYRLELWSPDGRVLRTITRDVGWFPSWFRPMSREELCPRGEGEPRPLLSKIHQDENGLLWVATAVADRNWREAVTGVADCHVRIEDWQSYLDTMIEVLEPRSGEVLAALRWPYPIAEFLGDGLMGAVVLDDIGEPSFVVWKLELIRPTS